MPVLKTDTWVSYEFNADDSRNATGYFIDLDANNSFNSLVNQAGFAQDRASVGNQEFDTFKGARNAIGSDGDDIIRGALNDASGPEPEFSTIYGLGGDDLISDASEVYGGDGNDTIFLRTGSGTYNGGGDDDTFIYAVLSSTSSFATLDGGAGSNTLVSNFDSVGVLFDLSIGSFYQFGFTQTGQNYFVSNIQNVTGGDAVDFLSGDGAANILSGRGGNDTLTGYGSADTFFFEGEDGGTDTITDFVSGEDIVGIGRSGFNHDLLIGTLQASGFVQGAAATADYVQFIYDQATGSLKFDTDGTGAVAAVEIANLGAGTALTHSDIRIVEGAPVSGLVPDERYSITEIETLPVSEFMTRIKDYDGNNFGVVDSWLYQGQVDIQNDGDLEYVYSNRDLGRWATLGPDGFNFVDFDNHGAGW